MSRTSVALRGSLSPAQQPVDQTDAWSIAQACARCDSAVTTWQKLRQALQECAEGLLGSQTTGDPELFALVCCCSRASAEAPRRHPPLSLAR